VGSIREDPPLRDQFDRPDRPVDRVDTRPASLVHTVSGLRENGQTDHRNERTGADPS